jgi:hypothetical protein
MDIHKEDIAEDQFETIKRQENKRATRSGIDPAGQ